MKGKQSTILNPFPGCDQSDTIHTRFRLNQNISKGHSFQVIRRSSTKIVEHMKIKQAFCSSFHLLSLVENVLVSQLLSNLVLSRMARVMNVLIPNLG